jgi:aspartate/glutamate racemase
MNQRIIIIGGMGPQASMTLHRHIIDAAAERGAVNGHEFPEILHLSLPVRDFISSSTTTDQALSQIVGATRSLYLWQR